MHFFNPAPVMKLVEVIRGVETSAETIERIVQIAGSLGKEPVQVVESPGFVVNRLLIPMINEAMGVLAEGVASAEDIDKAMVLGANHPIGPLALSDLIGNDVTPAVMDTLYRDAGDPEYRAHTLLRKMVRAGDWAGRRAEDSSPIEPARSMTVRHTTGGAERSAPPFSVCARLERPGAARHGSAPSPLAYRRRDVSKNWRTPMSTKRLDGSVRLC